MTNSENYIRVGTTLYKVVYQPCINGYVKKYIPWNYSTLKQDYGRGHLPHIATYDGFCVMPDHINYQSDINGFLNLYQPIEYEPQEGEFPNITKLVNHIFKEQYDYGMDYLQLLYLKPKQKLPILLLVSEERNTGKTTFLNFLKILYGDNVTYNTNENFRSQFNSDWAGKLLIVVGEVLLSRREDSERLKNLSTATTYKMEAKGKDRDEIDFFGKFVLCSNNESLPVIIESGETRYWVRKIKKLTQDDTAFIEKVKKEIPAFLYFLQHRSMATKEESRMWFKPTLLKTEALNRIIRNNRDRVESDANAMIIDIMDSVGVDSVSFCIDDLCMLLSSTHSKVEKHQVRKLIQDIWKLNPACNSLTYKTYIVNFSNQSKYEEIKRVGRFYTITRAQIDNL